MRHRPLLPPTISSLLRPQYTTKTPTCIFHPNPRPFSSSPRTPQQPQPNHYEVLDLPTTTSQADLKKQFYVLSKKHHPDLHPNSPHHTQRFQQISESYSVLANPEKRRRYDRDVLRLHHTVNGGSGFAGSRSPSGLSKRRSAFKGPPPSYFGHGQRPSYQSQSQSQSQSQAQSKGSPDGQPSSSQSSQTSSSAYGPEPQFGSAEYNPLPTYRTQTHEDTRRAARHAAQAAAAQAEYEADTDLWARFIIVACMIIGGITVGGLVISAMDPQGGSGGVRGSSGVGVGGGGMVRGDGSLRRKGDRGKGIEKSRDRREVEGRKEGKG